ncbi:MAG: DNRLRE domain-containing protein [Actinobacteria bacterium]|nr:MAG: DNRLRE domain-containing protein [Actinomycetota bacterium]
MLPIILIERLTGIAMKRINNYPIWANVIVLILIIFLISNFSISFFLTSSSAYSSQWNQAIFNGSNDGTYNNVSANVSNSGVNLSLDGALPDSTVDNGNGTYTTTLQPGSSGIDAYVNWWGPDTNYGDNGYITAIGEYSNGVPSFIKYDLGSIPASASLSTAQIGLYFAGFYENNIHQRYIQAHRTTSNWSEDTVTFNSRPSINPSYTSRVLTASAGVWHNFNVTADVAAFLSGTPNYGWAIQGGSGYASNIGNLYCSSDYLSNDSLRPKLVVTYSMPYKTSGSFISSAIAPEGVYGDWGAISFNKITPGSTSIAVDVLDTNDNVILSNVSNGANLGISTSIYPSIKLKANLSTPNSAQTPTLSNWSVEYNYDNAPVGQEPPNNDFTSPPNGSYLIGTVILTSNASDNAGIDSVSYYDNNLSNHIGTATTSPYTVSWNTKGKDGAHTLYSIAKNINGLSTSVTKTVYVDNYAPRIYQARFTRVKKGRYAKLYYKIVDPYSGGKASVIIKIKKIAKKIIKKNGKKKVIKYWKNVKAINLGQSGVGFLRYYRLRANMAKGKYRFYVYATDRAGNRQFNVASNQLHIK